MASKKTTKRASKGAKTTRKTTSSAVAAPKKVTRARKTSNDGAGTARRSTTRRSTRADAGLVGGDIDVGAVRGKSLVIVESPAKAKTISKYLGPDFRVRA